MTVDYNKTINLPKTDFPMRAGLTKSEPNTLEKWYNNSIYQKMMDKNEGKPLFILHDGPPYANGDIHMGHALNKILKDFIIKYKNMSGFKAPYIPGWDTHGLPIELQAMKNSKIKRDQMTTAEFRSKCEEFALKNVGNQLEQFKRLGVLGEWDNPYITLKPEFEAKQIEVFAKMYENGYIYKGLKPVYWCPHCETALAEAEIEYADHSCNSIYVKFEVKDDKLKNITANHKTYFVIWTTTTWTLPANVAICVNPNFEYDLVKVPNGEIYILAKELVSSVMKTANINEFEIIHTVTGEFLENMLARHPFMDRDSLIITGQHVTLEAGTGCVHTAPGHGADDFIACSKYDLPVIVPVNNRGVMTEEAGAYAGQHYSKISNLIEDELKEKNALLEVSPINHSYPHCWRCKNPVIFRATNQWFCSVDSFKDETIKACQDINFIPSWGKDRLSSMIRERNDWCISRQRVWGVPIPIFYCEDCGKTVANKDIIMNVAKIFADEGSNAWFTKSAKELCNEKCSCGSDNLVTETDIMDVWFDSGVSHVAVLETRENLKWPADLYLEGGDQHRGWFQSSLLTAMAARGSAPYKNVLTHGWVVDGAGKKMSKSVGNVIKPDGVIKEYGADILRLWVSSADYKVDMRISPEMFKQLSGIYLKIRNTAKYILGNLDGIKTLMDTDELLEIDRWALMKLTNLENTVKLAYESYEFHNVYHSIHNFCVLDMSNFYLDVLKDRLYCEDINSAKRESARTAMYIILDSIVKMLAPIISFTADEIWTAMPHINGENTENILLNDFPNNKFMLNAEKISKWDNIILLREDVNGVLEKARADKLIGKPLEANITISTDEKTKQLFDSYNENLADICIVSKLEFTTTDNSGVSGENISNIKILVEKATGEKCERCWIYSGTIGTNENHKTLCTRCADTVEGME